jgi:hypothetical protein
MTNRDGCFELCLPSYGMLHEAHLPHQRRPEDILPPRGPEASMKVGEIAKWFASIPGWQQTLWVLWLILGLLLLVISLNGRRDTSNSQQNARLERIENTLASLAVLVNQLHASNAAKTVVVPLALPEPASDRHFGWRTAVRDTAGTQATQETIGNLFQVIEEPTALVNQVLTGAAEVRSLHLNEPNVSDESPHAVHIEVANQTDRAATFAIPKGQVFENADVSAKVQNLVADKDVTIVVPPHQQRTVTISAYCLNQQLPKPKGEAGNITPLRVRFAFSDQGTLWSGVKATASAPPSK